MRWNNGMTLSALLFCGFAFICLPFLSACNRDENSSDSPETASPTTAPAVAEPTGVDSQDAPQAPRVLPDTGDMADWIKTEPIRQIKIEQLPMRRNDATFTDALSPFAIDRIWTCQYTSTSPKGQADVVLLEVADSLDAFGLFSVLTRQPGIMARPEDGAMLEIDLDKGTVDVTGWQGKACLMVQVSGFNDEERQSKAEHLARRILFSIPSADPPFMMRAIPQTMLSTGKVWMVHRTNALGISLDELKSIAAAGLDSVLGLMGKEKLWIAAIGPRTTTQTSVEKSADRVSTKHLIWIAEYTDAGNAREAFDRYQHRIEASSTGLDHETRVCEPRGRYLAGTWTADAESDEPLLPTLVELLPADDELLDHSSGTHSTTRTASAPR